MKSWLLPCVVALLALDTRGPFRAQDAGPDGQSQKSVLALFTTGRNAQISVIAERDLPQLLSRGIGSIDYNSEYFDTARFPDIERHQTAFREFVEAKYNNRRLDLVMAMHESAIDFLAKNRKTLFSDVPIVFYSTTPVSRPFSGSTGLIGKTDFARTIDLAVQLQPDITRVFVVSGASDSGREMAERARSDFQRFQPHLSFTYLSGLPTPQLEQQLSALPSGSIVFYLIVYEDGLGERYDPLEYLDRIAAVANRPIYSWVNSAMGRGVIGGSMQDQRLRVEALASLARRVLRGEPADSIPIEVRDLQLSQLDWRQLRRWGIDEARVPAGTQLLFREPGIWDEYKQYILVAAALLLAQSVLIAGLLIQGARRRKAEALVLQGQTALRASYDRIRDLGSRLLSAQEAERSRIARELHDDVSQQTAILAIDLQFVNDLGAEHPDSMTIVAGALKRSQAIARSVHDLSHRLHPAKLRLVGLVPALGGLQNDFAHADLVIAYTHQDVPGDLPHDVTLCLFRIAQEALQNASKHGHARHVSMTLTHGPEGLTLTVVDDGVGFDVASAGNGLGLTSMRERLDPLGGNLEVDSKPGRGTSIRATIPNGVRQ